MVCHPRLGGLDSSGGLLPYSDTAPHVPVSASVLRCVKRKAAWRRVLGAAANRWQAPDGPLVAVTLEPHLTTGLVMFLRAFQPKSDFRTRPVLSGTCRPKASRTSSAGLTPSACSTVAHRSCGVY